MDIAQIVHGTKGIPDVTHDWEGRCRELEQAIEFLEDETALSKLEAENKRLREAGSELSNYIDVHYGSCDMVDNWDKALKGVE